MKDGRRHARLRPVQAADRDILFKWANDPDVRANSFDPRPIAPETHLAWLERVLADSDVRMWILEVTGAPVGIVRYQRGADEAGVGISIAREHRGHGHGVSLLLESAPLACSELGVRALVALVLPGNEVSARAFLRAGFEAAGETEKAGRRALRFVRDCVQ